MTGGVDAVADEFNERKGGNGACKKMREFVSKSSGTNFFGGWNACADGA